MIAKPPQTLLDFLDTVYRPFRMMDSAPASVEQLAVTIRRFTSYLGHAATLNDLTERAVAEFMAHGLEEGKSPVTCNSRRRMLVTIWRFAKRKKYPVPEGEDLEGVDKLREPKRVPRAWTSAEMEAIIESTRLCRGRFCGVPADKWWAALVLTIYDTGLRRNAALAIRFDDIDFKSKMLLVPAERMKNAVDQYFRLSDQTIEAILESIPPRRAKVFPWPFTIGKPLNARLRMILFRARLPFGKRDLFHKFRRTTASHLAQIAGKDAARTQLGHQHFTSINRYIDPRFTSTHDGARLLPRPSWSGQGPIEIESMPEDETAGPRVVQVSEADLKGTGDDHLSTLVGKEELTAADIRLAIDAMGISHRDFAEQAGICPQWLSTVLNEQVPIKASFNRRIKIALGLDWRGVPLEVPRGAKGRWAKGGGETIRRKPSDQS